jgi:hypothetical protein
MSKSFRSFPRSSFEMLLRKACPEGIDWDETLPDIHKDSWQTWTQNLNLLNGYQIPRMYTPTSLSLSKNHGVLIYSDASEKAVAAAAYLQMTDMNDQYHLRNSILPLTVKGERKPMGSNMLLTAESKPLLVNGLSTTGAVNTNESVLRYHVNKHVFVDDALTSLPTADMAVSLLKRTRETLRDEGNIRLPVCGHCRTWPVSKNMDSHAVLYLWKVRVVVLEPEKSEVVSMLKTLERI